MPQYQTFGEVKGGSDSPQKLIGLKLDRLGSLRGKSALDLGCNEGFFCQALLDKGATRVLGVDKSPVLINKAKARVPGASFMAGTWWDIPDEKFDLILFLSAVHYEHEQKALFAKLRRHLNPGGTMVLECGLAPSNQQLQGWLQIYRGADPVPRRYPTTDYLTDYLMPDWVVSAVGSSVTQKGDPIPRWVLHCQQRQPIVIIATGASGDGKSVLAKTLGRRSVPVYRTDALFRRLQDVSFYAKTPLAAEVRSIEGGGPVIKGTRALKAKPSLIRDFIGIVLDEAPLDADMSILEGEVFSRPEVMTVLLDMLGKKGIVAWTAERQDTLSNDVGARETPTRMAGVEQLDPGE